MPVELEAQRTAELCIRIYIYIYIYIYMGGDSIYIYIYLCASVPGKVGHTEDFPEVVHAARGH